ncbi:MAG: hypothetical protein II855_02520, partial [Candidatus Methanomethylophilaceae archaeon]|nr:hypothetical protein [Candidatus Methanomethylophilaceae archaeon]
MSKTQINILFTAVGNQKTKEGKCKIGNVTEIIENETHPYPINQDEEIYERIKPDIVYLFVTKDSVDNAREIYNIYKDREDVEILVQPENCFTTDENEIIHYTNAYDFTATVQSFYSMKTKVMNLIKNAQPCNHPLSLKKEHIVKKVSSDQPEIKFFVNLTAGTKIVSAAASV